MKTFKQFIVEYKQDLRDEVITGGDVCFKQIDEASLSRVWEKLNNVDFAIITAYRKSRDKEQNVAKNRELRGSLNAKKLGAYPLVGHWRECELTDVPYDKCPADKLHDVIERSYLVPRNKDVSPEEFKDLMFELAKKYEQDGIVLKIDSLKMFGVYGSATQDEFVKFEKGVALNKMSQAYSQYVKKLDVPFIFEGLETPSGTVDVKNAFRKMGFLW